LENITAAMDTTYIQELLPYLEDLKHGFDRGICTVTCPIARLFINVPYLAAFFFQNGVF